MRIALTFVVVAALALIGWQRSRTRQIADVQREVMSAVKVGEVAQPLAGMSARARIEVKPIRLDRIGRDTASAEFHRFMNRCHTCHVAPDPQLHRAAEWPLLLDRMHANMRAAGTLGLAGEDREAVLRFLMRNAAR